MNDLLHNRGLRGALLAGSLSHTASMMTWVALPWFVLSTTGSATRMSFVMAAELLPIALLGLVSGAVPARFGARFTLLGSDTVRAVVMVFIPTAYVTGILTFPLLLAAVAVLGTFLAPYLAAQRAMLPELVGESQAGLGSANAYLQGALRLAAITGPVAGGVLIPLLEPQNVLFVNAALYACAALLIQTEIGRVTPLAPTRNVLSPLAGARFVLGDPVLRPLAATLSGVEMAHQALVIALPVLVTVRYDADPRLVGLFLAAFGAGALVGVPLVGPLLRRHEPLPLASVALVAQAMPLWVLATSLPAPGVAAALAIAGVANSFATAPLYTAVTLRVPARLRSHGLTAMVTLIALAGPVGLVGIGPVLDRFGLDPAFFAIAAISTAAAIVAVVVTRGARTDVGTTDVPVPDPQEGR